MFKKLFLKNLLRDILLNLSSIDKVLNSNTTELIQQTKNELFAVCDPDLKDLFKLHGSLAVECAQITRKRDELETVKTKLLQEIEELEETRNSFLKQIAELEKEELTIRKIFPDEIPGSHE